MDLAILGADSDDEDDFNKKEEDNLMSRFGLGD
jgi:hypothetical protein